MCARVLGEAGNCCEENENGASLQSPTHSQPIYTRCGMWMLVDRVSLSFGLVNRISISPQPMEFLGRDCKRVSRYFGTITSRQHWRFWRATYWYCISPRTKGDESRFHCNVPGKTVRAFILPKGKRKKERGTPKPKVMLVLVLGHTCTEHPQWRNKEAVVTGGPKFKKKFYKDNYSTCPFHEALSFIFATNIPCFSFQHLSALLDCSSGAALLLRSVSCCACRVRTGVGLRTSNTCCPIQGHRACWEILVASNLMLVQHGLNLLQ
mmetsp:Transcript_6609/g.15012  ORF Transcript_6609/g.15012 Transcript_6609/m.15012 type:complete len:265 (+) Transcript_6609:386-1180(+)